MKNVGSFLARWTAYGVTLVMVFWTDAAQVQFKPGTAKAISIQGLAQYSEAGGPWKVLEVGKVLKSRAMVKIATNSVIDFYLKDNGPILRITPNTILAYDRLAYDDTGADPVITTQLDLKQGRILGMVKVMADASRYEVKIPGGLVDARGDMDYDLSARRPSEYDISANGIVCIWPDGWVGQISVKRTTTPHNDLYLW